MRYRLNDHCGRESLSKRRQFRNGNRDELGIQTRSVFALDKLRGLAIQCEEELLEQPRVPPLAACHPNDGSSGHRQAAANVNMTNSFKDVQSVLSRQHALKDELARAFIENNTEHAPCPPPSTLTRCQPALVDVDVVNEDARREWFGFAKKVYDVCVTDAEATS